jgi:hypothetical protein
MSYTIPKLDVRKHLNSSPHLVILGAGASLACAPKGDKFGRKLPLMNSLISDLSLDQKFPLLQEYGNSNFEEVYDLLSKDPNNDSITRGIESEIHSYFGSISIPDAVTLYDKLILSLRKKDLIASFNWDPLLIQAYERNVQFGRGQLPDLVFLHGNVAVGYCAEHRFKGYVHQSCPSCGKQLTNSQLLFPVTDKKYRSNEFIASEWRTLELFLEEAFLITIYGYSAPQSDVNAIDLMQKAWDKNTHSEIVSIEVIDIKPEREILSSWSRFNVNDQFGVYKSTFSNSRLSKYPRRSCDAVAWAILQQDPWHYKEYRNFKKLDSLHKFLDPVIEEEVRQEQFGTPFTHWRENTYR